ncbi:hypothetical protein DFH07DRAFT_870763 [Mycena maculata]|uniref:CxC2-like cysteine cluster KDZ transposase-associated domain-containing protein n=1 Tax=Mycena maculata TaxID=230809 RepID=A0AAD7I5D0_9AGAR|nr:hypothetical protein DFH07DRAFT_870763 [Mycena maculata]
MANTSRASKCRPPVTEIHEWTLEEVLDAPTFTTVSLSRDTRCTHETTHSVQLPSPLKKKQRREEPTFSDLPPDFEYTFEDLSHPRPLAPINKAVKSRAKRYLNSWVPLRDEYLAEFLRLEGRGDVATDFCPACPEGHAAANPRYRCMDCTYPDLLCQACCVREHANRVLDRIEASFFLLHVWNGVSFKCVSLKSLGLRVQLGHSRFKKCGAPISAHQNFVVLNWNGFHEVAVDYCGCSNANKAGNRYQQLLRLSWYPSTHAEPQTVATFRVLELFHIMTLQGKVTTYDFYSGLEKMTDNTGMGKIPDHYKSFMRMMREWRHLILLKRGGRGNNGERDVSQTKAGELGGPRFLYILYIAIDACFRLKRRLVSSEMKDPALGSGWAFFTEDKPYREYLKSVTDQKEMSTCSGLAALDYANTKFSRGYGATGVGLGVCARHEFVQKNGVGDLQKGERYANMDYIFGSLLRHHCPNLVKYISYDICCQWSKNLVERLKKLPPGLRLTIVLQLVFLIPKLHIYGHKLLCQLLISLNFMRGSARTDGEGIERPWANIGPVATSTREMGPGSRSDTLDDHWSHWNWQKLVELGLLLLRRLLSVLAERNFQEESLATFSEHQKAMVVAWDKDKTQPNPYELPKTGVSEHDVRLQLVEEEAKATPIHNVSPSAFILAGLELEEQQRRLRIEAETRKDLTTKQTAEMLEKRTKLGRYTARFRTLQGVYTPAALQALAEVPPLPPEKAEWAGRVENIPLFLPSALSAEQRMSGCFKGVAKVEERLRDAQCQSALDESRFRTYKDVNAQHQGATTCTRALMDQNDMKMRIKAEKYIAAWEAKRALVGDANVSWKRLNPKKDLRCMDSEEDRAMRQKRKIRGSKRAAGEEATAEDKADEVGAGQRRRGKRGRKPALRMEWCKAWARTDRWREEVELLKEEVRRVPISLHHRAAWWLERQDVEAFGGAHAEGVRAYATRQAELMEGLAGHFEGMWSGLAELESVPGEVERREEEIAAAAAAIADDDDGPSDDDGNEAGYDDGEERMEGDDEGSVGGEEEEEE